MLFKISIIQIIIKSTLTNFNNAIIYKNNVNIMVIIFLYIKAI